jgi:hypothetical protein
MSDRKTTPAPAAEILTDEHGRPIERPRRADFSSDVEFMHAFHAFKDRVANMANAAFAGSFRGHLAQLKAADARSARRFEGL